MDNGETMADDRPSRSNKYQPGSFRNYDYMKAAFFQSWGRDWGDDSDYCQIHPTQVDSSSRSDQ